MKACCVCYDEETAETRLLNVTGCQHQLCHACYETWLKQCERQFKTVPQCPDCKQETSVWQAAYVLSRAYEVAQPVRDRDEESLDKALQTWLIEHECKQCAHCGAYIEREDGCDAVMCLCGYRFCWTCEDLDECQCEHYDFYDNVRGYDTNEDLPVASKEELQDLKRYLGARKEGYTGSESASESRSSEHDEIAEDNSEEEIIEDAKGVFVTSMFAYEEPVDVYFGSIFDCCEDAGEATNSVPRMALHHVGAEKEGGAEDRKALAGPSATFTWANLLRESSLCRTQSC